MPTKWAISFIFLLTYESIFFFLRRRPQRIALPLARDRFRTDRRLERQLRRESGPRWRSWWDHAHLIWYGSWKSLFRNHPRFLKTWRILRSHRKPRSGRCLQEKLLWLCTPADRIIARKTSTRILTITIKVLAKTGTIDSSLGGLIKSIRWAFRTWE